MFEVEVSELFEHLIVLVKVLWELVASIDDAKEIAQLE